MLPLLVLADDPASDARLVKSMTIEERYLPLTDFATRVKGMTGVPLKIDGAMAERKITLLVDGRPVAETMRMAANALAGRWVRIGPDWHLRPDPQVARDEEAAANVEDAARRAAVLGWAERFAKDPGPSGEIPAVAKASGLIAKIGPKAATDVLLSGRSIVATTSGREGTVKLSLDGVSDNDAPDGLLSLRLPEGSTLVIIRFTPLGGKERGGGLVTGSSFQNANPPPSDDRRAASWGIDADPATSARAFAPLPLEKEPYPSGLEALADALARVHARSGIPVVAESFRAPLRLYGDVPGNTVGEAMRGLAKEVRWTRSPLHWRSEEGWILTRPAQPWAYRPGEIPESNLRPLEGKEPTLDQYADLAARLTEPQIAATAHSRPLVRFSTAPFTGFASVRTLALFGTLTPAERRTVRDKGLGYAQMSTAARERWDRAYGDLVLEFPSNDGTYLDLLGGKRPDDAGLRIHPSFTVSRGVPGRESDWNAPESRYAADSFVFRLDPNSGFSLVVSVPNVPVKEWAGGS